MNKNELLVDYCQRCGAEMGSSACCKSSTSKKLANIGYETLHDLTVEDYLNQLNS